MSGAAEAPRVWGGTTLEERQRERRQQLLDAGVRLIAAGGGQAVSVRAVCRESGLTSRYFYEQFEDRDQFTVEVFGSVAEECEAAVRAAVAAAPRRRGTVAAATVDAVVSLVAEQPAKGRVLFVAPATDPIMFEARARTLPAMSELIAEQIPGRDSAAVRELKAASLVGALTHAFFLYVDGQLDVPRETFVAHCVSLLESVATMKQRSR